MEKAVYDAEILKVKNAYAAVTAQAKLKREEQARQSSRQEIAHSIAEADVLTSELTDLLILGAIPFRRILPGRVFPFIQPWSIQQVISTQSVIYGR